MGLLVILKEFLIKILLETINITNIFRKKYFYLKFKKLVGEVCEVVGFGVYVLLNRQKLAVVGLYSNFP